MIAAASVSSHQHARTQRARPIIDKKLRAIDISQQQLHTLPGAVIEKRLSLEHLIADGNNLNENALHIPRFPRLKTLSLNANKIRDVSLLLEHLQEACPNLEFLSLIGNPGWPHPIHSQGNDLGPYKKHRHLTARALPRLKFLDSAEVRRKASSRSSQSSLSSCATPSPPSTPEVTPPPSPLPDPIHKPSLHFNSRRCSEQSIVQSFETESLENSDLPYLINQLENF
ncbi:unnamed protein product, partial [Mesorhabditis belari]|uniref:Uncharacterized protein n=1 Tax=Mesorhabditis belari TaxID=2138241 RepID=A0AAF3FGM5_9BILA